MSEVLNVIGKHNHEKISVTREAKTKRVAVYFMPLRRVIIDGMESVSYSFWLSKTKLDDRELNADIFNVISNEVYDYMAHSYKVLWELGETQAKLDTYIRIELRLADQESGDMWVTPFGKNYKLVDRKTNGAIFAQDLVNYYEMLQSKCTDFESNCNGEQKLKVFEMELKKMGDDVVKNRVIFDPILRQLAELEFVKLSKNASLRLLYKSVYDTAKYAYDRYMDKVR